MNADSRGKIKGYSTLMLIQGQTQRLNIGGYGGKGCTEEERQFESQLRKIKKGRRGAQESQLRNIIKLGFQCAVLQTAWPLNLKTQHKALSFLGVVAWRGGHSYKLVFIAHRVATQF